MEEIIEAVLFEIFAAKVGHLEIQPVAHQSEWLALGRSQSL
jgi:hypothetical protein